MNMHLEATDPESFALVSGALEDVDRYRSSRDVLDLQLAKAKLHSAKSKDPRYFRAHYVEAIVDDLSGHPLHAVKTFSRLLDEPLWTPDLLIAELRYHLGLAWYHQYSHEALDRAIEYFTSVLAAEADPSLHLLTRAGLAQAHAMRMIPKRPDATDMDSLRHHFRAAMSLADQVLRDVADVRAGQPASITGRETPTSTADIEWTARNARGMALVYYSDYLPPENTPDWQRQRAAMLREAIEQFRRADQLGPGNWANDCDQASAMMRLGYYERTPAFFEAAVALLQRVVEYLRPDYGFALYEMGRVYRLWGKFELANRHFERALKQPSENREVSDRRVRLELRRTEAGDRTFP